MTPGKLDLQIFAFATFTLPLAWTAGGVPVDLTGYKSRLQIRERASSATPALSLDTETRGGIVFTNPTAGGIEVTMTDEQTGALGIKSGLYDLVLEAPGGAAHRLLEGTVTVHPAVTRP